MRGRRSSVLRSLGRLCLLFSWVAALAVRPIAAHGAGAGGDRPLSPTSAGDRYADLAVGVPLDGTEHPEVDDVGAANVLYGSSTGLTAAEDQLWHQASTCWHPLHHISNEETIP
jgi:hypothetical protein